MGHQVILMIIMPYLVLAMDMNFLNLGVDYVKYRDIKFVCFLDCNAENSKTAVIYKFASNQKIAVSRALITSPPDFSRIEKCLHRKFTPVAVIIDSMCQETENVLNYASENMLLDSSHSWLIIDDDFTENYFYNDTKMKTTEFDDRNMTMIEVLDITNVTLDTDVMEAAELVKEKFEMLENLNISVDADIVVAIKDSTGCKLFDVYNYGKIQGGNLIAERVGSWNTTRGFVINVDLNAYKYYRRRNFQNISLRMILVGLKTTNKEALTSPKPYPGVAVITQTTFTILYVIAEIHNFSYALSFTDRWIGTYEKNSSKGVSTFLYFRVQDISPVLRFSPGIQEKLDIINPALTSIETRYFYKIPTTGPGKFENQFLRPLSPNAWWCGIAVSLLCAGLLLLSALLEHRPSSLQYAVFSVLATVCQQCFEDIDDNSTRRQSSARKVTIFVTGLFCVLIFNYYTSSVVSWLLNGPPPSINSLRELLESPLELIYEEIGYTRSWLQNPQYYYNKRNAKIEDELRQKKVFNKKKGAPLFEPLEQGIKMVQKGGYAYHTEVNSANGLISRIFTQSELCELGSLQSMEKTRLYSSLQKNSPFKEFMKWSLLRLLERGIISCIQRQRASAEVKCEGSSPRALALGGAAPAFILLAGGFVLATGIMMVERFVYRYRYETKRASILK